MQKIDWENTKTGRCASLRTILRNRLSFYIFCIYLFILRKSSELIVLLSALTNIPACLSAPSPIPICHSFFVFACETESLGMQVHRRCYTTYSSAEANPTHHHSLLLPARVTGAQNTYNLLSTCVNKPLQLPLSTKALTLHLLSCSSHLHSSSHSYAYMHSVGLHASSHLSYY